MKDVAGPVQGPRAWPRLGRWMRLAILASVLWIAAGGYTQYRRSADAAAARTAAGFQACSDQVEARGGGDFKACLEASRRTRQAAQAGLWGEVAAGALIPPVIAWALLLALARAARGRIVR